MMNKLIKKYWVLMLLLLIASFLRLYQIDKMTSFDFDQEYAANFAYNVIKVYPIQLIGQGLSVQGLFMGPLYFYYLTPFYFIFGLHPIGGAVGSVLLGVFTIIVYYFVLKNVFNERVAIIGTILRAFLFTRVQTDLAITPAFSSELGILLTFYFLYKFWKGNEKSLIILGFLFGLYTSFHPILFPFYIIFVLIFLLRRKIPSKKILFLSVISFLLPLTPLLLFEYFHNFLEIKLLLNLGSGGGGEVKDINTLWQYVYLVGASIYNFLGFDNFSKQFINAFSVGFIFILCIQAFKRYGFWRDNFHAIFVISTVLIFIGYYFLMPTHAPDYYFLGPIIVLFIYFIASLELIFRNQRVILFSIVCFIVFLNLILLKNQWSNKSLFNLSNKEKIVKAIVEREKKNSGEFSITYIVDPGRQNGFDYLFKIYGEVPGWNYRENNYKIFLPKFSANTKFDVESGGIGLIFPKENE